MVRGIPNIGKETSKHVCLEQELLFPTFFVKLSEHLLICIDVIQLIIFPCLYFFSISVESDDGS